LATPNRSAAVNSVLTTLLARLRTVLAKPDGYVRLVVNPNPTQSPYRAEEGVHVAVFPPSPVAKGAGGRYATLVKRLVEVHVVTKSLLDVAGRDDLAAYAHLTLEEAVVDAVMDLHPSHPGDQRGPAVQITWVPGGDSPKRMTRKDTGLILSVLSFELSYAFPFTV
jgi:hypothetical protein